MSATKGTGLEGCLQLRGRDGGVSATKGAGLEGCLQLRGPG